VALDKDFEAVEEQQERECDAADPGRPRLETRAVGHLDTLHLDGFAEANVDYTAANPALQGTRVDNVLLFGQD
jgi:hypothetical protein